MHSNILNVMTLSIHMLNAKAPLRVERLTQL